MTGTEPEPATRSAPLRSNLLPRTQVLLLLVLPLLAAPLVAVLGADARDLDRIRSELTETQQQLAELEERLEATVERFAAIEVRVAEIEAERDELERQLTGLREEHDQLEELVSFRIRETFKHGNTLDPFTILLASDDPTAALDRVRTVQRVVASDRASSEDLMAARTRLVAAEDRLADRSEALEEALEEQDELAAELEADFERASQLEAELTQEERDEVARIERERREREQRAREERERRERERQQAANASADADSSSEGDAAAGGGGMVCPLDQPRHFTDTWGAARGSGRSHRGTDIMGPRGTPVRAITSGTWNIQTPGASAGLWAILHGDNGDHYWYLHLDSHTVSSGARVAAGDQVGTNGATGNATPGAEHVHFELHPGGGAAVNPYSLLRSVCG